VSFGSFFQATEEGIFVIFKNFTQGKRRWGGGGGGIGVLSDMGYIGMCGPKGYGFSSVLVMNKVWSLAILALSRVWFSYSSFDLGMLFRRSYFQSISKSPSKLMFRATVSAATVINRVSNFWPGHKQEREITLNFGRKWSKGFGKRTADPAIFFWEYHPHIPPHPLPPDCCILSIIGV